MNVVQQGSIASKAMLANLSIKLWAASKHDKTISAEVAVQHGSDEKMGRFNKSLLCKDAALG